MSEPRHEAKLQAEIERLRGLLIDPGSPAWEDARAVLVAELRKNGMHTSADHLAVSHGVPIPSWIALNLIAHASRAAPTPFAPEDQECRTREDLIDDNQRLRACLQMIAFQSAQNMSPVGLLIKQTILEALNRFSKSTGEDA